MKTNLWKKIAQICETNSACLLFIILYNMYITNSIPDIFHTIVLDYSHNIPLLVNHTPLQS